jgi:hypothetical protein
MSLLLLKATISWVTLRGLSVFAYQGIGLARVPITLCSYSATLVRRISVGATVNGLPVGSTANEMTSMSGIEGCPIIQVVGGSSMTRNYVHRNAPRARRRIARIMLRLH